MLAGGCAPPGEEVKAEAELGRAGAASADRGCAGAQAAWTAASCALQWWSCRCKTMLAAWGRRTGEMASSKEGAVRIVADMRGQHGRG